MKTYTKAEWAPNDTEFATPSKALMLSWYPVNNSLINVFYSNSTSTDGLSQNMLAGIIYPISARKVEAGLGPGEMLVLW